MKFKIILPTDKHIVPLLKTTMESVLPVFGVQENKIDALVSHLGTCVERSFDTGKGSQTDFTLVLSREKSAVNMNITCSESRRCTELFANVRADQDLRQFLAPEETKGDRESLNIRIK